MSIQSTGNAASEVLKIKDITRRTKFTLEFPFRIEIDMVAQASHLSIKVEKFTI